MKLTWNLIGSTFVPSQSNFILHRESAFDVIIRKVYSETAGVFNSFLLYNFMKCFFINYNPSKKFLIFNFFLTGNHLSQLQSMGHIISKCFNLHQSYFNLSVLFSSFVRPVFLTFNLETKR